MTLIFYSFTSLNFYQSVFSSMLKKEWMERLMRRHEPGKLQRKKHQMYLVLSLLFETRFHHSTSILGVLLSGNSAHNSARIRLQLHQEDAPLRSFFFATVHVPRKFLFVFSLSISVVFPHGCVCVVFTWQREKSHARFSKL